MIPQVLPELAVSYTLLRFEINIRASAIHRFRRRQAASVMTCRLAMQPGA
jgi:hypothetical protein